VKLRGDVARLSVLLGDEPPSEFRVFKSGENATTKGTFVFDDKSAASVIAAFEKHGTDGMIDLEHLSAEAGPSFDPDARGWFKLALRDGDLYAVDVKWTPDGAARLADKRQRYISPSFAYDKASKRITSLMNIALTAQPATDNLQPLVAANARGDAMDPKILAALGLKPDATVDDALAVINAMKADETTEGDPALPAAAPAAASTTVAAPPPATVTVAHTSDRGAFDAAAKELHEEIAKLKASNEAREVREFLNANPRKVTPAVVKLCESKSMAYAVEMLSVLPERPAAARAPHAPNGDPGAKAIQVGTDFVQLSQSELAACRDAGCEPETYAMLKARRNMSAES
jgi:phage I-like protein